MKAVEKVSPYGRFSHKGIIELTHNIWADELRHVLASYAVRTRKLFFLLSDSVYLSLSLNRIFTRLDVLRFSALCYKPEGHRFDSRWDHWIFQLT
jgi:hypothetical protein